MLLNHSDVLGILRLTVITLIGDYKQHIRYFFGTLSVPAFL